MRKETKKPGKLYLVHRDPRSYTLVIMEKPSLSEAITKTLVVQERDCKILRCQKELDDIPVRKEAIKKTIDDYHHALDTARETLKTEQASIHKLDVETETKREHIVKLREQQFQIKSNEEYKTLNREIAHIQEEIKALEDQEIDLMENAEQAKADTTMLKSELEQEENNINQELQQLEKRRENLESEIHETKADRDRLAEGIDQTLMERYNRIMENRKDAAVVNIENGACGACHMNLPAHVAYDIKKGESIVTCNFCGRILYSAL